MSIHVLGPLCRNKHNHRGTGQSLRYSKTRQCVECLKEWQKEYLSEHRKEAASWSRKYYHKNRDKQLERMRRYQKTPAFKASAAKHRFINKEKLLAATRAWRKTPRGRLVVSANNNKRRKMEPNKARFKYTPELLEHWNWLEGRCAYCQERMANTYDHFIPLGEIGEDVPWNLVPACRSCNCSKGAKDPFIWFSDQEFYSPSQIVRIMRRLEALRKLCNEALSLHE